jgi:IS30 family transposase
MQKQYIQLTLQEREKIFALRARGKRASEIARILGRDKSTISRELCRNRAPTYNRYSAHSAHKRSASRNSRRGRKPKLAEKKLRHYVVKMLLKEQWSPEIIAAKLAKIFPGKHISHETIYKFIYDLRNPRRPELIKALARHHRRRKRHGYSRRHRKTHIPSRRSIKERPARVNSRKQPGHWEVDTIVSRRTLVAIGVMLERRARYVRLARLRQKSARLLRAAINRRLGRIPKHMRRTITYDNGSENTEHVLVNKRIGTKSFFCEPYHSYEKGGIEQVIGLLRRWIPKGCDLSKVSSKQLKKIEKRINNRPRKCLQYLAPLETYKTCVALKN